MESGPGCLHSVSGGGGGLLLVGRKSESARAYRPRDTSPARLTARWLRITLEQVWVTTSISSPSGAAPGGSLAQKDLVRARPTPRTARRRARCPPNSALLVCQSHPFFRFTVTHSGSIWQERYVRHQFFEVQGNFGSSHFLMVFKC